MINSTIGVIFAMDKELQEYLSLAISHEEETVGIYKFYKLNLESNTIILAKSGIGKVHAGALTSVMILKYQPSLIINSGIAGGVDHQLKLLDTIIADKLIYSDVDMTTDTSINVAYGQLQGFNRYFSLPDKIKQQIKELDSTLYFGGIMSGDQFVTNRDKVDYLVNNYFNDLSIMACDMESAAYAQICEENKVAFIAVRTVSDVIGNNNVIDYGKFCYQAALKSAKLVNEIIKKVNLN